jgi:uncharacterized membrane protein
MKKLLVVILGILLIAGLWTPKASADVNDFVIEEFKADYTLGNGDRQGNMRIVEQIDVNFSDNNHGILRAIPNSYKKHRLQLKIESVTSDSGAPAQYTTYDSSGNTVLKIGDPNRTVTGRQSYTIAYTVRNVISFYDDHDELFWDVNGDQWAQQTLRVSAVLHLPYGAKLSRQPVCYAGSFGDTKQACELEVRQASQVEARTSHPLQANQTLSMVVGFDKGFFAPSAWYETASEYAWMVGKMFVPMLLVGGTAWRYWRRNGRDPKGKQVIVPEYEAPDGLKPIEAGTILDFRTDNNDISATIVDLAIRRYITIIESTVDRKILKDKKVYNLRLEKTDFSELKDFEKSILEALFKTQEKGTQIDLKNFSYKLSATATKLRASVRSELATRGYFGNTPFSAHVGFGLRLLGVFFLSLLFTIFAGGLAVAGLIAGAIIAVICIASLPKRTAQGVEAKEKMLGLKLYLEVAEAERIKKLQSPDAPYAAHSAEPKKTVHLFEKLLPFAMVLGVEQEWAKQFEHIYTTPPDWYSGNWTTFSAIYLTSALSSGVQSSVNTAFSAPSSSSSSGFSGGGSGGGGGGGGGGGW